MDKAVNRYEKGIEKFKEIKGDGAEGSIERLKSLNPDLEKLIMEFAFCDVYKRPSLDLRSREIATIASLATLGNAPQQLKVHVQAALNVGVKKEEIVEVILQMAIYAGFPAAINAMQAACEVFDEIDNKNKTISNGKSKKIELNKKSWHRYDKTQLR
ncbi:MAG: carboxymuconolactone decarboxylase family protein [Deltaproteobacteria bacterium]